MRKTNEKNTASAAPGAAPGAGDLAVVQSAPAATPTSTQAAATPSSDPFHGRGGLYTVVNGRRERVNGTAPTPSAAHKESA